MRVLPQTLAITTLALAFLGSGGTTTVTAVPESTEYLAVIDAGSGGTRLTLYSDSPTSLLPQELTKAKTNARELSAFDSTPTDAGPQAITPLLQQLDAYLAEQGIARENVPVSLLATAGMRNLRRDNPQAADAIFTSTAQSIANAGHPVADNRILPAVQEATLAWLDTNVLAGTATSTTNSLGVIWIGGASAQVAYRSPATKGSAVHAIRVDGQTINLVAVSYLGLGGNDARDYMQDSNDAGSFCFPNNATAQLPETYVQESPHPVRATTAQFSWTRCTNAYRKVIVTQGGTKSVSSPVSPSELRTLPGFQSVQFLGLGSIPPTFRDLAITSTTHERYALRTATTSTCSGTNAFAKVSKLFANPTSTFAETLCSTATYQHALLFSKDGIGIQPSQFSADDSMFTQTPSWTSGYAITVLDP